MRQVVDRTARGRYFRPTREVAAKAWVVFNTCGHLAHRKGEDRDVGTSGKARLGRRSRAIGLPRRAFLVLAGDEGAERVAIFLAMIAPSPAGKHPIVPQTLHSTFVLRVSGLGQVQNEDPLDRGARDGEKDTLVRLLIVAIDCLRGRHRGKVAKAEILSAQVELVFRTGRDGVTLEGQDPAVHLSVVVRQVVAGKHLACRQQAGVDHAIGHLKTIHQRAAGPPLQRSLLVGHHPTSQVVLHGPFNILIAAQQDLVLLKVQQRRHVGVLHGADPIWHILLLGFGETAGIGRHRVAPQNRTRMPADGDLVL